MNASDKAKLDTLPSKEEWDRLIAAAKRPIVENNEESVGLFDNLSPELIAEAKQLANDVLIRQDAFNENKNLDIDIITVPGQKFCAISWTGPTFTAKTTIYGYRILGAFDNAEKAVRYANKLHNVDKTYDIGIMEMNLWCLGYPSNDDIITLENGKFDIKQMQKKLDDTLNEFVIKHKTDIEESNQLFELRKRIIMLSKITKECLEESPEVSIVNDGKISEELEKQHKDEINNWIEPIKSIKQIDEHLEGKELDDNFSTTVRNQNYAVVSYIENSGKNKRIPIKILGVFNDSNDSEEYINKVMNHDDTYDLFIVEMYRWIPCDPDCSKIRQIYSDKKLNDYFEKEENSKEESMQFHQAKLSGKELKHPMNKDFTGKGTVMRNIEEEEEITPVGILESMENSNINTKSYRYDTWCGNCDDCDDCTAHTINREPKFISLEENEKLLEERITTIMFEDGLSREEARLKLIIPICDREIKQVEEANCEEVKEEEEEVKEIVKLKFDDMISKLNSLKEKGLSKDEIRKIMSE